jgi:co-chaperonin GroES (HSP10)
VVIQIVKDRGGKIMLPEGARGNNDSNIVVSVGEKVKSVKVGEQVLVLPKSGLGLDFPGIQPDLCLVQEEAILAVIEPMEV